MKKAKSTLHSRTLPVRYRNKRVAALNGSSIRSIGRNLGKERMRTFGYGKGSLRTKKLDKHRYTWWGYIWSGLVRDPTARHHKAMRRAIWLFLYFIVVAGWRNGRLYRRISTIAAETGFKTSSIHRWLRILRDRRYISTTSNGRFLRISINKWRPISGGRKHDPKR